jgi:uncharacterized protein YbcC (UPF0753/DUF2309 family)
LLPAQGPITVFVHHNTLHAFEELPFSDAVIEGSRVFGCHPYLPEERYWQELVRGRIREQDLAAVLFEDLGERADALLGFLGTRYYLRLSMLRYPVQLAPDAQLRWLVAESDALKRFRREAPLAMRTQAIEETRHWVMRDLRLLDESPTAELPSTALPSKAGRSDRVGPTSSLTDVMHGIFSRFDRRSIEDWTSETWESFYLQLLWRVCHHGVRGVPRPAVRAAGPLRHRDLLMLMTGRDSDALVHDVLIRFCGAFLDQGIAGWTLPGRNEGFFRAFLRLYQEGGRSPERWRRGLQRELTTLCERGTLPLESLAESLDLLGIASNEEEGFIRQSLLALRGWSGMVWQMESRADRAARPAPPGSLVEMLAVRMILERHALAHLSAETLSFRGPLRELRPFLQQHVRREDETHEQQRAFLVFQLAQVLGWKPQDLFRLSPDQWRALVRELEEFSSLERRRVYHLAFERRYRQETLDAVAVHARRTAAALQAGHRPARERSGGCAMARPAGGSGNGVGFSTTAGVPRAQVICCIDEREESFRRHLEELAPEVETFGAAGFFYVAMYYRGAAEAHYVPLCPVIIQPKHYVLEYVPYTLVDRHRRSSRLRRAIGAAVHRLHHGSRTVGFGALASLAGSLATVPLVARVLFPRATSRILRYFSRFVQPPPTTQLQLERTAEEPGPEEGQIGFSLDEMAAIVERLLRDMGLTTRFARLVVVMGHGSSSLNNPHESAHDCGACGGGRGGPNARALALMANDPRVRDILSARGLNIPRDSVFVGAYHNTCDERVTYFDLERLPLSHAAEFNRLNREIDEARQRNAHERCRRFESAPLSLSPAAALRHVEGRAEDLAQVRPEYGHATNAVCIVGRRSRTRGLFLDRRSFLVSYDPTQDDAQQSILSRILQAVVPVCAGINLEYYFSFTDPTGWGCGTKLPHNVAGLLGVMDGAASDLRPGLPWQMVEIHEPVRLLFVVEATPDALLHVLKKNPQIARLCQGGWVQLATLDPETDRIDLLQRERFHLHQVEETDLPEVDSSIAWYRGWRDHLGYARVCSNPSAVGDAEQAAT